MGICCTTPVYKPPRHHNKPFVRMCSSGNHFPNFADIGDTVVLFVDFGKNCMPLVRRNQDHSLGGATAGLVWPDRRNRDDGGVQYEIKLAGLQAYLQKVKPKNDDCTSFRSQAKILMTDDVLRDPGGLVKFIVPYCNSDGEYQGVVTEEDIEYDPNHRVYNHPLWDELIVHNEDIRQDIKRRSSSRLMETTYGSVGRQRHSLRSQREAAEPTDQVDAAASVEVLTATDEHDPLLRSPQAKRYWPDSWEMSWWRRHCCDPMMRSRNCFTRFWAAFFVAPLTNVTGFSLYYQLYLAEIFHQRFLTKLGHYLFMPLIVMMMMTFFAQWRFLGCYTLINTEVLILNGTAIMAFILMIWYTLWGLIQKTPCMGFS
ncbi:hypothetical protein OS493_000106 [Desmophyllum pertusum]|uniref:Uncharacterized protein n=1 Tax=Desmophyllum pertusum TaxID=174260 RepID=A0A9X0DDS7_9CNID|nr:hypothetical protein OS493_000106 [Desmophyllum pertusum]